ncbi:MAG: ArsC/Spx/MgsR family protein [Thiobacillaceae bacterium]
MASIVFYEKPGCSSNAKQKVLLAAAGHSVWAKNLLTEKWTPMRLRPFFGDLPVSQWFNLSAPRIKSGELDPAHMSEDEALLQMVRDPLLIRRPLMEVGNECRAGFDPGEVDRWIGLQSWLSDLDLEACSKSLLRQPCSDFPS